jgi:hypothetical protein
MANPSHGRLAKLLVDADGAGTYTNVGGVVDATLDDSGGTLDTTDHDSPIYREFIYDRNTATIEASCNYEEGDVGQDLCIDSHMAGIELYFEFQPKGAGTGLQTYKGHGFVTKATIAAPNGGQATLSLSIQINGALTQSAQP